MKYGLAIIVLISGMTTLNARESETNRWVVENHIIKDVSLGLMWQDTGTVKFRKKTWDGAQKYCQKLNFNHEKDWRLPTLNELLSIVDYAEHTPAVVNYFKHTNEKGYYWTSSNVSTDARYAWYISFDNGNTYAYSKEESVYVRCVRDDI